MPRLFVAIDLPPETKLALSRLCADLWRVRWVKPENLHLTLRFIGEVDEARADGMGAALAGVRAPPFVLQPAGVGRFGRHTLWVGIEDSEPLRQLQAAIEDTLRQTGLPAETRPFAPHVKTGRLTGHPSRELRAFQAEHARFCTGAVTVARFSLMASRLGPGGPVYSHRADYPLTAGGPRPAGPPRTRAIGQAAMPCLPARLTTVACRPFSPISAL